MKTTLILGLLTTHIGGHDYNEQNHLRAVQVERVVVGTMINSFSRRSYIAAYDIPAGSNWGVLVGGASGYDYDCMNRVCLDHERDDGDIMPIVSPYYSYGPAVFSVQGNAFVMSLRFNITN